MAKLYEDVRSSVPPFGPVGPPSLTSNHGVNFKFRSTNSNRGNGSLINHISLQTSVTVQWGSKCLVKFNAYNTKLLSLHHHRDTPVFRPVTMGR